MHEDAASLVFGNLHWSTLIVEKQLWQHMHAIYTTLLFPRVGKWAMAHPYYEKTAAARRCVFFLFVQIGDGLPLL